MHSSKKGKTKKVTFRSNLESIRRIESGKQEHEKTKKVRFGENYETIIWLESRATENENTDNDGGTETEIASAQRIRLTEELTVLSSEHGRARRYLRNIEKVDLKAAIRYGVKTKARKDPQTGLPRYKFTFNNTVFITDETCRKEVTCFREPVTIVPASLTPEMWDRHHEVARIIEEQPQLCESHTLLY